MPEKLLLAIDQGTTSSRAIAFDRSGKTVAMASKEFAQYFPQDGWVEHDPEEIWSSTIEVCRQVAQEVGARGHEIASIGVTNQRETTLVWNRKTGRCLYNAIVWQDRRTAERCEQLVSAGHQTTVGAKTGLLLDPYFSGTKLAWILDNVDGSRQAAARGELAFGTIDSFLLWRLTDGKVHATDATNASRTMMFDIHRLRWDSDLLGLLDVPAGLLPDVMASMSDFGTTTLLGGELPIQAMLGDQQAALVGQACLEPGMAKSTYGTGCFMVLNTGNHVVESEHRLLSTIGYMAEGCTTYAIEGSIFNAGSAVQWLRDGLGFVQNASETEAIAERLDGNDGVYVVPAFTGLGAPYWNASARGAILGLTRDSGPDQIVRATLESVAYQTHDLVQAMRHDGADITSLRIDGGMALNSWFAQFLADVTGLEVQRTAITEATAWGAAALAGVGSGLTTFADVAASWECERKFQPGLPADRRQSLIEGWNGAVKRVVL